MKKEAKYTFIYEDKGGNEITRKELPCYSKKEAVNVANRLFAECMINDCVKVKSKKAVY